MRTKIVAGNWKMNNDFNQSVNLVTDLLNLKPVVKVNVVLCPPMPFIHNVVSLLSQESNYFVGAQNVNPNKSGAFTGEISTQMLQSICCKYVIVGHSERREYFNESNDFLKLKVNAVIETNLIPIFCCGESLAIRNNNVQNDFVKKQLTESLFQLSEQNIKNCVIAYEPIWAIGTGLTASANQAQEMHEFIRFTIAQQYSDEVAKSISILYGGSCNAANAEELFAKPDVDGGLIGGASLKAFDFVSIINALEKVKS
jgi:triosephosphate isomerase (TIM)